MKLVVGIVLDTYRNPYGYMVLDTDKNEKAIERQLSADTLYNQQRRNDYIQFSCKGKVLNNKDATITYVMGDNAWAYTLSQGWGKFSGRLTDKNVVIVNPATVLVTDLDDEQLETQLQTTKGLSEVAVTKAVVLQSAQQWSDDVYSAPCKEYQVCRELKLNGVQSVCDLTYYTFTRLMSTLYFAEVPKQWAEERIGKKLALIGKALISDGYSIIKCRSKEKFMTHSVVVQGSVFNTIYLLIDSNDELVSCYTSYSELEEILDNILSLDNLEDYPENKEIYTIVSNIHIRNPRADIEWVGAIINRADGGMYLATRVRELGKVYWLRLLSIANYAEFLKWATYFDTDEAGMYFSDMLHGIESIIRKSTTGTNNLLKVRLNPTLMLDTQYKFAI